jgi:SAM-dependent methyltransferase
MEAGCEVLGVEVDERMAAFAHNTGVVVEVARFEEWNPKGRRFDGVAAGQAWHWIHPVEGAAKAATVLRPSGLLALFWNGPLPPPELAEACNEIFRQAIPESPFNLLSGPSSSYTSFLTRAFDGIEKAGRFEGLEDWQFEWERTYTKEQWLDQLPATGALTSARPDQIEEVLTGVGGVVDAIGGHFEMRFVTVAAIAVRI